MARAAESASVVKGKTFGLCVFSRCSRAAVFLFLSTFLFSFFFAREGLGVGFVFFFLFPFTQFLAARENCGTVTPMGKYMLGKKRMRYIRNHNLELGLAFGKRMCSRCGEREVYQDTKTMDWCEPCIAEFVDGGNDLHIAR
jgi:hypothetical protein